MLPSLSTRMHCGLSMSGRFPAAASYWLTVKLLAARFAV